MRYLLILAILALLAHAPPVSGHPVKGRIVWTEKSVAGQGILIGHPFCNVYHVGYDTDKDGEMDTVISKLDKKSCKAPAPPPKPSVRAREF